MSEWKEYKLKDFLDFNPYEKIAKDAFVRKIGMEHLQPFNKKISGYLFENFKNGTKFRNEDTLLSRITPCLENGKTAFVDILDNDEVAFGSTEFIVLRKKKNISDSKFIYYLATSEEFRDIAIQLMTGSSGRQRVQTDALKDKIFKLPNLNEQKTIAEILSSLDDKIDLLNRKNKTLEALAQTYFRQWFVEEANDGWEKQFLINVVSIVYGKQLDTKSLTDEGYPVFGANGQIGFFTKYTYESSQVLVSCRGEASGTVNISFPNSFVTSNTLILERNKNNNISFSFLKYWALNTDFHSYVTGSAQPQLTIESLKNCPIILPPVNLINKFEILVDNMEIKIDSNTRQIQTLQKLRDTLLPKLISGEVRVKQ